MSCRHSNTARLLFQVCLGQCRLRSSRQASSSASFQPLVLRGWDADEAAPMLPAPGAPAFSCRLMEISGGGWRLTFPGGRSPSVRRKQQYWAVRSSRSWTRPHAAIFSYGSAAPSPPSPPYRRERRRGRGGRTGLSTYCPLLLRMYGHISKREQRGVFTSADLLDLQAFCSFSFITLLTNTLVWRFMCKLHIQAMINDYSHELGFSAEASTSVAQPCNCMLGFC